MHYRYRLAVLAFAPFLQPGFPVMRDEIAAFKRERILREAVSLFYKRGFTGTTLDEIAHELGVTKPFIYTHFKSKTDLLAEVCLPMIKLAVEKAEVAAGGEGTATERLRRLIAEFTCAVLENQERIAVYFRDAMSLPAEIRAQIDALRKKFDRILSGLLLDGVNAGEFEICDVALAALAMGGMISWAYTWHRPDGRLSIEQLCSEMAELALKMAGARTGATLTGTTELSDATA
jgi:TetR/AcrR family transcriptional regulator, cholesterol catabolism regulator